MNVGLTAYYCSLIAIMLGRLEMDVDSCIKWYIYLCKLVFSNKKLSPIDLMTNIRARFDSDKLEEAIKKVMVQHGAAEEELLKKPENSCKVYVHTLLDMSTVLMFK